MYFLNAFMNCAEVAPSTTRWSQEIVQRMTVAIATAPLRTTGCCTPAATARMQDCGGLITAVNSLTPNMPRFEIEKVPPWNSSSLSLLDLARAARSLDRKSVV